ncbi:hypothetical protein B0H13DRAFT_2377111 [Mycena leptocephala]|nr:hypothetical protein B0H13DRAFT_2377111 [Mycena leptocephala]
MIPATIDALPAPPPAFIPCEIPNYLGSNFKNHTDFSQKRNKHYWILFVSPKQGVYSLKVTCLSAKGNKYEEANVVGDVQMWKDVLAIWAKHCFHRHGKCRMHQHACVSSPCPAHAALVQGEEISKSTIEREPPVKRESVKREVKEEGSHTFPAAQRASCTRHARQVAPPSYTRERDTEEPDSDGAVPLYDEDSPSPTSSPAGRRQPSYDPDTSPPRSMALRRSMSLDMATAPPSPVSSRASSSVSSLSTATPPTEGKMNAGSSVSHGRPVRGSVSVVSLDDPFYVSASGSIHHSSAEAFSDVEAGPVQVVMGWEAATSYARRVVAGRSSPLKAGSSRVGGPMDVDK